MFYSRPRIFISLFLTISKVIKYIDMFERSQDRKNFSF